MLKIKDITDNSFYLARVEKNNNIIGYIMKFEKVICYKPYLYSTDTLNFFDKIKINRKIRKMEEMNE